MNAITEADREAANVLREILAHISGFWHQAGDDSPICQAMARHRLDVEQRLADKLAPFMAGSQPNKAASAEPPRVVGRGGGAGDDYPPRIMRARHSYARRRAKP